MKEISFRIANDEDQEFIRELARSAFSYFGNYDEILARGFIEPGVITMIGSINGHPVSFAMFRIGGNEGPNEPMGEILAIAVRVLHQRQGVGKELLKQVEYLGLQYGLGEIHLQTGQNNVPALSLFQKVGYKVVGLKTNYYPKGQSAWVMVKKLAS